MPGAVDLGYLEKCETWQLESRVFPSKVGGKPAWLSLKNLPTNEDLTCPKCSKTMIFLCQVYAPFEEDDKNFHRTVFIFICKNPKCCERNDNKNLKVFRSNLERTNEFYSPDPPKMEPDPSFALENMVKLCKLCGCAGDKCCSQCKKATYCCKEHQLIDWKLEHKIICNGGNCLDRKNYLFEEWELIVEPEEIEEKEVNVEEEMEKYNQLKDKENSGSTGLDESELEDHATSEKDKVFAKFRKRVQHNPDQVIRYDLGGSPLWIAELPKPEIIPKCEHCGEERRFEFQIMPQMLTFLKQDDLDWGILAVYTCKNSCISGSDYKNEFIFKQDVSLCSNSIP